MIKLLENPLTLPLRVTCESIFGVADALVMSRSSEGYYPRKKVQTHWSSRCWEIRNDHCVLGCRLTRDKGPRRPFYVFGA